MPDHVGSETESPGRNDVVEAVPQGKRNFLNRGLVTALAATGLLIVACLVFAPSSLHRGTLLTMLPFAAALAVAGLGQTLVVMQGGIDLSVAGGFSLYVVILTKYPAGDNARLWTALAIAFAASVLVGCVNGMLIGRRGSTRSSRRSGRMPCSTARSSGTRTTSRRPPPRGSPASAELSGSGSRHPCTWP